MSKATSKTTLGGMHPPSLELVEFDMHPDDALLRVCVGVQRLRAIADELERIAASMPARTGLRRRDAAVGGTLC